MQQAGTSNTGGCDPEQATLAVCSAEWLPE